MAFWNEVKSIFREEVSVSELTDTSRAGARLRNFLLLVRETWRSLRQDDAINMASALAFKTLLAIVPMLAITLAVLSMLDTPGTLEGGQSYTDSFIEAFKDKMPAGQEDLVDSIKGFAKNAWLVMSGGVLFLFVTAFSLLTSIETAFNKVWQVRERRAFLNRVTAYMSTLVIVPIFMSMSVYMTAKVAAVAEKIKIPLITTTGEVVNKDEGKEPVTVDRPQGTAAEPASTGSSMVKDVLLAASSLFMTCIGISMLLYLMPFTPVRVRAALAGGISAGIFFEVAKYLFKYYAAQYAGNYTKIYGPLLALPMFLLWIWLVWVIVLIGAEIAFTAQNFRDLAVRAEIEKRGVRSRIYLAVRIVLVASSLFRRGESPEEMVDYISDILQAPPYLIREITLTLVENNVLRRVTPGREAYLPAKDITTLSVMEVVEAVSADMLDVPPKPVDPLRDYLATLFSRTDADMHAALGECTFAKLVAYEEAATMDHEKTATLDA